MSKFAEVAQLVTMMAAGAATVRYAVQLVLGVIVAFRARAEDLPKIVRGLALWFRWGRK